MKKYFNLTLCILLLSAFSPSSNQQITLTQSESKTPSVQIIFDTDIAGDYDDVGAMAMLHAFADKGEIKILATISSNAFQTTIPTISVLNIYFGRPEIPCGITKRQLPNEACSQKWAEAIVAKYPHHLKSNNEAMDAIKLYRKILANEKDQSVTIVTVGFFTNLAGLLDSKADEYSALNGKDLIKKKVKLLISMAAALPEGKDRGSEYNVNVDAASSQKIFSEWNTPVILSGFGIGEKIFTGIRLINNTAIQNSPVKDAFQIALNFDKNTTGRMSWDQTAVLVAARGYETYFNSRKVNLKIEDDGSNVLIPGEKFIWLSFKKTPLDIQTEIEDLMMHQPKVKK